EPLERLRLVPRMFDPGGVGAPVTERRAELREPRLDVADDGLRAVLGGVEAGCVEADQGRIAENRPGAGREVLQARAEAEDDIRLGGEAVRVVGAGDADRTDAARMVGGER